MYTFIIVLLIIVSILLCLIVLVQNSKGGGLAANFSASNQVMGVRKTTDLLEKLTWVFAISLIALAIIGNFVLPKGTTGGSQSIIQQQIDNTAAPAAMPQAPAPAQQQPAQQQQQQQPAQQPAQPAPGK